MDGALWADEHPNDEVLKLRKMFESDPDAYKQGYKDAIDNACEFMEGFLWSSKPRYYLIEDFKRAMEE